ncbi:hypothetical protein [Actinomadura nitritigenes]|uniref:hypothetical protein n=1 Tax=Actinomadura nitritigenes TaxID=134602 RepID=UPI003D9213FB
MPPDGRTSRGSTQDVLAGEEDVPGTSYVDALQDLAAAHVAASGGGRTTNWWLRPPPLVRALPPGRGWTRR